MTKQQRRPDQLYAIDPGDVHVGLAGFAVDGLSGLPYCEWTAEYTPGEAQDLIAARLRAGQIQTLVIEDFRLYEDKAAEQTGSRMLTPQLIGVLTYLVRVNNRIIEETASEFVRPQGPERWTASCRGCRRAVELVFQNADVKRPTLGVLKAKGIKSRAATDRTGGHAKDAEIHGWHWLLRPELDDAGRRTRH